jgi:hypothetical protein
MAKGRGTLKRMSHAMYSRIWISDFYSATVQRLGSRNRVLINIFIIIINIIKNIQFTTSPY